MNLLEKLFTFTDSVFKDPVLLPEEPVRQQGEAVMTEVKKTGFATRALADKLARPVFVTIQSSAERKAIDEVHDATSFDKNLREAYVKLQSSAERSITERLSAAKFGQVAKSIWIIHTPLIATPCVTDKEPSPKLMAEEILKDPVRKKLTLDRAIIIRDYLKAGGILIVAYDKAQSAKKRTSDEIAVYNKLRAEYKTQIIDFPIDFEARQKQLNLKEPVYPMDLIGATYIMQDTTDNKFEMTNLGVQANEPRDDAKWGVWMHNREQAIPEVSQRMAYVFDFLEKAGINPVLEAFAREHKIKSDNFAPLLCPYLNLQIDPKMGKGCKVQ